MMLTTLGHFVFATLAAFSPDYWSFSWLRFFVALFARAAYLSGFVIRE